MVEKRQPGKVIAGLLTGSIVNNDLGSSEFLKLIITERLTSFVLAFIVVIVSKLTYTKKEKIPIEIQVLKYNLVAMEYLN